MRLWLHPVMGARMMCAAACQEATKLITPADRNFLAGYQGMAGRSIGRALERAGYCDAPIGGTLLITSRSELDLLDAVAVQRWFANHISTTVVLAAARVGGIYANKGFPAEFLLEHLKIQIHMIETAWSNGVRRLLVLSNRCMYPKFSKQPTREDALLTEALKPTDEWYAISQMPKNLNGLGDNYYTKNCQVMATLIRQFHEARVEQMQEVVCWALATPLHEFLHVDDFGEAYVLALEHWNPTTAIVFATSSALRDLSSIGEDLGPLAFLNVGTGIDLSIAEPAQRVAEANDYTGRIKWELTNHDGAFRKILDSNSFISLGWAHKIDPKHGTEEAIWEYLELTSARQEQQ